MMGWMVGDDDGAKGGEGGRPLGLILYMMKSEGNIKVFCRFRPFNSSELAASPTILHRINKGTQLSIRDPKGEVFFLYDHVFDLPSTQEEVFERVGEPVINNILDGFHGTIMAYGQTSSGKTHTMQGYEASEGGRGIMPRMIERLFQAIEKSPENIEFKLKVAIFELYCQKVRDLLDVTKSDLSLREGKAGYYIENLTERYVGERGELRALIAQGQRNRITCATKMNEHSSRSHLLFQLTLSQTTLPDGPSKTSRLFLIDLAGSEKISKTGAEGKVLEEAKKINLSLTNLGTVIKALSQRRGGQGHVPYRNSKLTRLLRESLGGNSKTTLIVTCSPHEMHLPETISTLRFGENAQKVKNKPKINRELTVQELIKIKEKMEADLALRDARVKLLEKYIIGTLKAELPPESKTNAVEAEEEETVDIVEEKEERAVSMGEGEEGEGEGAGEVSGRVAELQQQLRVSSDQFQQRIKLLQLQLQGSQGQLKGQMDKYYQLKREYHDLHAHLTAILSENIELRDQLDDKQRRLLLTDKSLSSNAYLLRMVYAEMQAPLDPQDRQRVQEAVRGSHWYQRAIGEGTACADYWQAEKERLSRELQQAACESQSLESQAQEVRRREQSRTLKDNEKILQLQRKLGLIFDEYNAMMGLQTHWKAECQLYERNLRKKDEEIARLQKQIDRLEDGLQPIHSYDFNDDVSVRSRLVKPIRGGLFQRG